MVGSARTEDGVMTGVRLPVPVAMALPLGAAVVTLLRPDTRSVGTWKNTRRLAQLRASNARMFA
ncbi:hypothetical protein HMPREF9946_01257 [Acetobacteraceae bacterium AT-5844]|nr:hypothetical protein HMPREF9946_01257 [Acetobacteraceae bacterium AT-5844]